MFQGGEPSVVLDTCVDLEGIPDSLQNDVVDIKKQAEAAPAGSYWLAWKAAGKN